MMSNKEKKNNFESVNFNPFLENKHNLNNNIDPDKNVFNDENFRNINTLIIFLRKKSK